MKKKVLIGGMTARVNRQHENRLQQFCAFTAQNVRKCGGDVHQAHREAT